jgi:hypothetical protein
MKTLIKFLAVLTVLAFSFAPSLVRAQDAPPPGDQGDQSDQGVSFQAFYDQLGDQGTWVQTDDYGYVFQPNVSDPEWAPYRDGHWVDTDEGWTWVSDEPWGWATYHYGRWANIDGTGWVWVPGYRWAPAWVSWRYGGGYAGWAPLPPETFVGAEYGDPGVEVGIGFHFGGDVDVNFNIGPGCYNFVSVGDLGEPNYRGRYIDRSRNYTVINNTTNITNINVNNGGATGAGANFRGVAAGGPPLNEVNAHSRQHVQTVQLTAANQPGKSSLQGKSLAVYAPRVNPASAQQAKPASVSQTIAHPTFNRGDSITKPLAVTASVKPPPPTPQAIQAAQAAQLHPSAKAKIATQQTTVKTPLTKPLTSLAPVAQVHRTTNAATPGANSSNGAKTVNPNAGQAAANSPFTGEPVKPTPSHTQTQSSGAQTYHPSNMPTPTPSHTQTQSSGGQTYHPSTTPPPTTYHPQTQSSGGQTYHPSTTPPPQTYHPQPQAPAQTYHPQPQAPQPQQQPHPQPQGGGGGGGGGGHGGNTNNAPGH